MLSMNSQKVDNIENGSGKALTNVIHFKDVKLQNYTFGVAVIYTGIKP